MRIEALRSENIKAFVDYCKKHRRDLDDSFMYDEDLKKFEPNDENPTYITVDEQGETVAAASLIVDDYMRRGKRGRFRIFHSELDNVEHMEMLLKAIIKHTKGLDKVFLFVPLVNKKLMDTMEALKFDIERYSFLLVREGLDAPEVNLPEGYEIRTFRPGIDEEAFCRVRNIAFATLKGNETPRTPEMIAELASSEEYIEGGMMILYHGEKPAGVIMGSKDEYEDAPIMHIGPLAILPEYQGNGLGRCLLRASLRFAGEKGYDRTILSVNGENDRAKELYIQEGFKQVEGVVCYKYDLA